MNKIFNWKNFTVLYLLFYLLLAFTVPLASYFSTFDIFALIIAIFCQIFGFGLCCAVAWKKQFFSSKLLVFFTLLTILSFPVSVLSSYLQMENSVLLDIAISYIILSFPMLIAFFIYLKQRNSYDIIDKPFLKLFCAYFACDTLANLIRLILINNSYNIFDYINIFSSIITVLFLLGYAWNYKIKNKTFVRAIAIYLFIVILLPHQLLSYQFSYDTGIYQLLTNPLGFIYVVLMSAFQMFIIYRFAFGINN